MLLTLRDIRSKARWWGYLTDGWDNKDKFFKKNLAKHLNVLNWIKKVSQKTYLFYSPSIQPITLLMMNSQNFMNNDYSDFLKERKKIPEYSFNTK